MKEFEDYLRNGRHFTECSIKHYMYFLGQFKTFLAQNLFSKDLNSAEEKDISEFLIYLKRRLCDSSIALYIITLRCYYNWAAYRLKTSGTQNIAFYLKNIIKTKKTRKIVAVPTREEVIQLRRILNQFLQLNSWNKGSRFYTETLRAYAMIELLITSGLRASELGRLRCQDVDLKNKTLFVRMGKGGHQRVSLFGESAVNILREYIDLKKFAPEDKLFSMRSNLVYRTVKLWAAKAEINTAIHPHSFRHYFITESQRLGVDLQTVADQVGHVDLNTTRGYTHLSIENIKEKYQAVSV